MASPFAWLTSPSASSAAAAAAASTVKSSSPFTVELPSSLSLLPSIFRAIALAFFLPVLVLAAGDCLGWALFKLILRPLGYSSVIRFKDPEPPTTRISTSSSSSSQKRAVHRSASQRAAKRHGDLQQQPPARNSSLPASLRPRRHSTNSTLHALDFHSSSLIVGSEEGSSAPNDGDGVRSTSPSPSSSLATSATTSTTSSPILMTYSLSDSSSGQSSLSSSPSSSPKSIDLALPHTTSSSILPGLRRHRARSVGVEGPLFGTAEDEEERGLMSPARSDSEDLGPAPMESSESEGEEQVMQLPGALGRRKRGRPQVGVPRRGFKFDFTSME